MSDLKDRAEALFDSAKGDFERILGQFNVTTDAHRADLQELAVMGTQVALVRAVGGDTELIEQALKASARNLASTVSLEATKGVLRFSTGLVERVAISAFKILVAAL